MTESLIPTSGSLSAKIIRACSRHSGKCPLDCKYRKVEDLGEIASFGPSASLPDPTEGLTTGESPAVTGLVSRIAHFFRKGSTS